MNRTTRLNILFLLLTLSAGAFAQGWMNDLLVHRTPSFTGEGAESCMLCHSGERMRAVEDRAHGDAENPLTPWGQHECESCHGPGSIHVSRAHGGKGFPPLTIFGYRNDASDRARQLDACLYCHSDENSGIKVTVFEGTLHDRWIVNCSACHQSHVESDRVLTRGSQAEVCLACHRNQEEGHPVVGSRVPDFGRMGCAGCHRVHRLPAPEKEEAP